MTVAELVERMDNREFIAWSVYHGRRGQRDQLEAMKARHKRGR